MQNAPPPIRAESGSSAAGFPAGMQAWLAAPGFVLFILARLHPDAVGAWEVFYMWAAILGMGWSAAHLRMPLPVAFQLFPIAGRRLLAGAALAVLYLLLFQYLSAVFVWEPPVDAPVYRIARENFGTLVILAMLASVYEELYFRGIIFPAIQRRFGGVSAFAITTLWFGMIHGQQMSWYLPTLLGVTGIGAILTAIRWRTGSTLASIAAHVAYNGTIVVPVLLQGGM